MLENIIYNFFQGVQLQADKPFIRLMPTALYMAQFEPCIMNDTAMQATIQALLASTSRKEMPYLRKVLRPLFRFAVHLIKQNKPQYSTMLAKPAFALEWLQYQQDKDDILLQEMNYLLKHLVGNTQDPLLWCVHFRHRLVQFTINTCQNKNKSSLDVFF